MWLWLPLGAAALFLCAPVAAVCICAHRRRPLRGVDCIVVLGAKVHPDGSLSRTLRWRCDRAWELWREGLAGEIIACGGRGADEPCDEGSAMADRLRALGVPAERIIVEDASHNTYENLRNALRIMEARSWRTAAIVTSDYHLQRALWLARDLSMDACGAAARSNHRPHMWLKARVREAGSWILYAVRKYLT